MRRTQLYLEEPVWEALHARARSEKTTVSDLVRQAVRKQFLGSLEERRKAMQAFVGIRKHEAGAPDSTQYVRSLRRGSRLNRLLK